MNFYIASPSGSQKPISKEFKNLKFNFFSSIIKGKSHKISRHNPKLSIHFLN